MRFTKTPGATVLQSVEDECMGLVTDQRMVPDDVTLPPELGGGIVRVLEGFTAPCPVCQAPAWHLSLADSLGVAECACQGFLWYRRREAG